MEIVLQFQILLESAIGIVPRTEVVELAPDLFGPDTGYVGDQGKVWIRLGWIVNARRCGTIIFGHGGAP